MRQNLGDEKVLAIPALSASYEKLPNALARARNEKVACSSQVTSSMRYPPKPIGFGGFSDVSSSKKMKSCSIENGFVPGENSGMN